MRKIVIGTVLGAAVGYFARKMQEKGFFDQMSDELCQLKSKTKKKFNDVVNTGKNEAEDIKYRAQKIGEKGVDFLKDS
ncbi:hypothetical protein Ga0061079_104145 [Apibacter mensalis]|uniref:YtxH-like protein n=1 Tax=Apibacter mensalis TaxID=1586267 RepID=A0A0X3ANT9_9FLAO|nr:YtxH domain-containing protein [Apibacter mensalis]CVK16026.1 hypothetical protein Ga0061079_104145 [Apibacter mensalis]